MAFVKAFDILSSPQCRAKVPSLLSLCQSPDSSWTLKPSVCYIQDIHESIVQHLKDQCKVLLLTFQSNVIGIWFSCLDSLSDAQVEDI